ncbi:hypothetical protein D9619_002259 [Psilocybe cf. subviscida]|uniref:Nephrocystin 3-like N-terminal domain-containing protein n=1 Tax=Psilocybe cf. subviscida TaxID=2480587 RepID=A0A8H5F2V2_9AGAR|nr:hypothetical protein D9619_002259 [Psilocybe cf. subviscida]
MSARTDIKMSLGCRYINLPSVLHSMTILSGSSNVSITGGTFVVQEREGERARVLRKLSEATAHSAMYDSAAQFDAPKCHPKTRVRILEWLERWMCEPLRDGDANLIWLHGGAGAGKSAILQTIAGRCIPRRAVLGTFFFSRTDSTRNYAEVLFPSLAYQMALVFPQIIPILDRSINDDPLLFTRSLRTLANKLLVQPLLHLSHSGAIDRGEPCARTFIIDAIDECTNPKKQVAIITMIGEVLTANCIPIKFLVASRPEPNIVYTFKTESLIFQIYDSISLNDHTDADLDIRVYIEDSFAALRKEHPHRNHLPSNGWPLSTDIDTLVQKSSGHFVYAATAMNYCASIMENPMHSLNVVLGVETSRRDPPFNRLDALYIHILRSSTYLTQVLEVLRHCTLTNMTQSLDFICALLDHPPQDIEFFLADVSSLVSVEGPLSGHCINGGPRVSIRQASVSDFLRDGTRAREFYIDAASYWASKLPQYLNLIDVGFYPPQLDMIECFLSQISLSIKSACPEQHVEHLLWRYTPRIIWDYCQDMDQTIQDDNVFASEWVSSYMDTIRNLENNDANQLYNHHLSIYIELLEDCCPIISPMIFPILLSNPPAIIAGPFLALSAEWVPLSKYLSHIYDRFATSINPRTYSTYINLPGRALDSGSRSSLRQAALRSLQILFDQNEAQIDDDHPFGRSSSRVQAHDRQLPSPTRLYANRWLKIKHPLGLGSETQWQRVMDNRSNYYLLLRIVRFTLLRIGCDSEIAAYTRRLLPMGALRFPRAARRLQRTMDKYTLRVHEFRMQGLMNRIKSGSQEALIERLRLCNINDID